MSFGNQLNE
jgi:hypothetical protein